MLNELKGCLNRCPFFCPGKEAALVIIVVACPPWRITHLYHIPMWIFDCVIDEVHDLKRACFESPFGGQRGYLYRIPVWIFDCVLDWLNAGRCDKGF